MASTSWFAWRLSRFEPSRRKLLLNSATCWRGCSCQSNAPGTDLGESTVKKVSRAMARSEIIRPGERRQVSWLFQVNDQRPRKAPKKFGSSTTGDWLFQIDGGIGGGAVMKSLGKSESDLKENTKRQTPN